MALAMPALSLLLAFDSRGKTGGAGILLALIREGPASTLAAKMAALQTTQPFEPECIDADLQRRNFSGLRPSDTRNEASSWPQGPLRPTSAVAPTRFRERPREWHPRRRIACHRTRGNAILATTLLYQVQGGLPRADPEAVQQLRPAARQSARASARCGCKIRTRHRKKASPVRDVLFHPCIRRPAKSWFAFFSVSSVVKFLLPFATRVFIPLSSCHCQAA
jgi:hypothetical protein